MNYAAAKPPSGQRALSARRSRRGCRLALAAGAVAGLVAGTAVAKPERPAETFADTTTTVLVEVPVEVTSDGKPLRGLSAANFELFDNGRAQEILGIDVVDVGATAEKIAPVAEMPVAARRHFLLLFDRSFSTPKSFEKAREAAYDLVRDDLAPSDLVAVATFSTSEGVRVPLGFTPDRNQALLAIQELGKVQAAGIKPDPLRLYVGNKSLLRDPGDDVGSGNSKASQATQEQVEEMMRLDQQGANVQGRREIKILSDSMKSLAGLLRQVNGRKHVVFFSEGFDSSLLLGGQNDDEVEKNYQAAASGEIWRVDSDAVFGNRSTISALDQLTEALRKSDCTLHSVDVAGLRAGGDQGVGAGKRGKDGLFLMARDTGGELFENFNDLGAAMNRLLEKTSVTYLLSYRPADLDFDGKYRKLKVKLKNVPDGRIVHRPGYFAPDAAKEAEDFGSVLSSAAQLLDRRKGEIEVRVLAMPMEERLGLRRYVPTFVDVAGATFLGPRQPGREQPKTVRADVFVYAFDRDGGIADFFSQAMTLDLAQLGEAFTGHGLRLYAPLALTPGEYTLRVLVRDPASGRSGVAVGSASVGDAAAPESSAARATPLPMLHGSGQEVLVRGRRKDLEGLAEPEDPFALAALARSPEIRPAPPAEDALTVEKSLDGMRQYYRQALAALQPDEDLARAVDRLEQVETAALGDEPESKATRLGRAEMEVVKRLADKDPEALVPLLEAHQELYLRHKKARRAHLELHSRQMVTGLASLYAERGTGEGAKVVSSRALASLGGYLLADGRSAALELLEKAAALDRRNEAAYLGLAAYYEKRGGPYESAVEALQRLVASRPESREGRLRLAVNLLRVAKTDNLGGKAKAKNAGEIFRSLLAAPENDWVTSLAAQELARFEFEGERLGTAIDLLEKTLARRPDDQEVMVQLAFFYDRLERGAVPDLLSRIGQTAEPGEAPRGRYNQWQSEALARDRDELRDGARQRMPILDQVLSTTATQEGR